MTGLNADVTPLVSAVRFYLPLLEPDGRISRIRLPDQADKDPLFHVSGLGSY